ncbi:MAG: proline dehydrogenase family protein [Methanoregulaceae archaeon]|nr:proline dehydrogenase family protein [Methanoregulaceae archaeon]
MTTGRWTLPDLHAALVRTEEQNIRGISCTLHVLDEYARTPEDADAVSASYREAISGIAKGGLDASISVKLSSLGALHDGDAALARTVNLCREASRNKVGFEIDMEGSGLIGAAIEAASLCRKGNFPVTLAIQAYLYRTTGDLRILLALGITPRFVKGAYQGDITDPARLRERFFDLVKDAHRYEVPFHIGTHDPVLIQDIMSLMGTRRDLIQFGFLLGLADRTKQEMAADLWQISEYIPYGTGGEAYIARRERYMRELRDHGREPAP